MEFNMVIDTTISIGNIAEIVSIIGGGFLVLIRMGGDIRVMKVDMAHMKSTISTLTLAFERVSNTLTQVAVQDARLIGLEKRVDELAHGRGYVISRKENNINGEYP